MNTAQSQPDAAWQGLARSLAARRLTAPAVLLLELLRPWRWIASQLLIMSEPLWGERRATVQRCAAWLQTPGAMEALLDELEQADVSETERP